MTSDKVQQPLQEGTVLKLCTYALNLKYILIKKLISEDSELGSQAGFLNKMAFWLSVYD